MPPAARRGRRPLLDHPDKGASANRGDAPFSYAEGKRVQDVTVGRPARVQAIMPPATERTSAQPEAARALPMMLER